MNAYAQLTSLFYVVQGTAHRAGGGVFLTQSNQDNPPGYAQRPISQVTMDLLKLTFEINRLDYPTYDPKY